MATRAIEYDVMNADAIKEKIEKLLANADMYRNDKFNREAALERASVWIQYLAAEKGTK